MEWVRLGSAALGLQAWVCEREIETDSHILEVVNDGAESALFSIEPVHGLFVVEPRVNGLQVFQLSQETLQREPALR